jgi:Uncharacterized protein conserved in bacteria (DUF2330)
MRRLVLALTGACLLMAGLVSPILACGGLIGPNGAVNLLRTTTLAGYHAGVEHYVTSFEFAGGEGEFGSIVPLPGIPSDVVKGGDWTLQRLVRETEPQPVFELSFGAAAAASPSEAQVLMERRIDALDITVLKGGANEVGLWAKDHGFRLPPDAPGVLDYYAGRSPIFLAARFDANAARARGQAVGDGTPIHVIIPTPNPWVPLRILGLGKTAAETVQADVYLLTDGIPTLLPGGGSHGLTVPVSQPASQSLLTDLHTDRGMEWVPSSAWLTKVRIDGPASAVDVDLAIDASGQGAPSRLWAGLEAPGLILGLRPADWLAIVALLATVVGGAVLLGRLATPRPTAPA